jgi:KaiC/GvpD/RAD55 family RecA-like ATPase
MKLLKTGIAGLDEFLQGGLPPKVLLLIGPPGSGNDIFARQVAHFRAKQVGVTYFTVTRPADSIKDDMSTYGWDISSLEKAGSWKFSPLTQQNVADAVIHEMKQHRTVVIDSLSELTLTHKAEVITLINSMSTQNRDSGELHLVLLTEGMQTPRTETAIQHFADGVIAFTTTRGSETTSRCMIIKKMRGTAAPTRMLPYSIGEKGFTIETATRIT